jgi:opacity protein-like surface antigen
MLFAAAASAAVMFALPAAAEGWYAQVNTGLSVGGQADVSASITDGTDTESGSGELDLENGFVVGAAAGRSVGPVRIEGEAFYSGNDVDDVVIGEFDGDEVSLDEVELRHMGFFANVLYDFAVGGMTPYVGAGVGYGSTSIDVGSDSEHDDGLAWQAKAGVAIPVNDTLTIDVGYRYVSMAEFEREGDLDDDLSGKFTVEPTIHALTVGARFSF